MRKTRRDIVQDTMVTAIEKFDQFKGKSTLKTWIFSIASRKTIDHLRKEKRWSENVMDKAKSAAMAEREIIGQLQNVINQSPHGKFEVTEHIELCFRCLSKTLPIEQQLALMLKDIFDFKVREIAMIIERSVSQVKHYLEDARAKMIDIYDRRCALINKKRRLQSVFRNVWYFQSQTGCTGQIDGGEICERRTNKK